MPRKVRKGLYYGVREGCLRGPRGGRKGSEERA